jgi:hypothetical protein
VIDTDDLSAVASALGWKPDFLADGDGLRYLHRRADGIDIYFVSNQTNEARTVQATFRVDGKQPEFWFPDSGHTLPVRDFQSTGDGRTSLTIPLDPVGSVFVVFSGQPAALPAKPTRMQEVLRELIPLTGPWEVAFQAGRGAPAALVMDVLSDLSLHADERVRYFAGEATYQTTFDWDMQLPAQAGDCVMLDLGAVHVVCDVTLNEHDLGILWKPPFQVDVTRFLKPGKNELTVRVANLWVNRLLGDLRQPDDCEWTTDTGSTAAGEGLARIPAWVTKGGARPATGRVAFAAWRWQHHTPEKPLLPSGLAGPVRLLWKGAPSPSCTRKNG